MPSWSARASTGTGIRKSKCTEISCDCDAIVHLSCLRQAATTQHQVLKTTSFTMSTRASTNPHNEGLFLYSEGQVSGLPQELSPNITSIADDLLTHVKNMGQALNSLEQKMGEEVKQQLDGDSKVLSRQLAQKVGEQIRRQVGD